MNKLVNLLILIPIAIVLIVLSVTNRQVVTFGLDPFNIENPVLSLSLPFFMFLFMAMILGIVIGSTVTWLRQRHNRRELREKRLEINKMRQEKEQMQAATGENKKPEFAPGLPVVAAE